ncbi:hypothetical protein Cni_G05609 [Canna indica]|uniref:Uncharacterized protein n=1 Tax=Canna indica TaxID=4628 RepID=A0AAQ3JVJ9_9LILI|nr:hypothetical protein Cni_G05609 [Canna indica]
MEDEKAIVARSPTEEALANPEAQSQISGLLIDTWQQVQEAIQSMVKMTSEIEQSSAEIMEEIEKCKESVDVRSKVLEQEKENLQKAAIAVLHIFNGPEAI